MSVRRRSAICREGYHYLLLLAFTLGLAVLLEANLLLVVAGMLCGPLLLNWRFAAKALRRVDLQRRVPDAVTAGEPLVVEIGLSNSETLQERISRRLGAGSYIIAVFSFYYTANGGTPQTNRGSYTLEVSK